MATTKRGEFADGVLLASCMLVAMALWPAATHADPATQARVHDMLARQHFERGDYEAALREFLLENRIAPNPRTSFNIALCFQELGRPDEAFMAFREYLVSDDPDEERRSYAERTVANLEPRIARVRVHSDPPGARIYVDERELGQYGVAPRVLAVPSGKRTILLELDGYHPITIEVTAKRGELIQARGELDQIVGHLEVASEVGGDVLVHDAEGATVAGGKVPLSATLPPGPYRVTVSADGHRPWTEWTRVHAEEDHRLEANPEPLPSPTGDITVTANLAGAVVQLDSEQVGFTPLVLPSVPVGEHTLRVARDGRQPWQSAVHVSTDERSWVTVSLEEPVATQRSPLTWVTGGVGLALVATGGIVGGVAVARRNEVDSKRQAGEPVADLVDRGTSLSRAADGLLVTGGIALVVATVLFFTSEHTEDRASTATIGKEER